MAELHSSIESYGDHFVSRAPEDIIEDMRCQYLQDDRPWVIGFSGGKDSTCTLQLAYYMLKSLPAEQRTKKIFVLSSDTLVEAPVVGIRQKRICDMIRKAAADDGLPICVEVLRPDISETFWVNMIGRGYPAPNRWFRWCTDRLKIKPMNRYIHERIAENGEVIILLGARKSESASRSQTMAKHEIDNFRLRKHTSIKGAFVYTPIEDLDESDVWDYLLSVPSPWGDDNQSLRSMYQKKDDEEIAFILDESSPPSGHSRFGCWCCTVVEEDRAIQSLIDDGHVEYIPLRDFRNELRSMRDDPKFREPYRKNQRIIRFVADCTNRTAERDIHRNHEVMGPFTFQARHYMLKRLLEIQEELRETIPDVELISPEEIKAIEYLWMYDGDTVGKDEEYEAVPADNLDRLTDRLLAIENDFSDLSRRVGIYKKLETVIQEYTMNMMLDKGKEE